MINRTLFEPHRVTSNHIITHNTFTAPLQHFKYPHDPVLRGEGLLHSGQLDVLSSHLLVQIVRPNKMR
jgi:hypothetical protein